MGLSHALRRGNDNALVWMQALGGNYELAQGDYFGCGDGTQFIVAFYAFDTRAYVQIDGRAVTLAKRLALSGSRYSGGGVTLNISKAAITVRHARRPVTACELA